MKDNNVRNYQNSFEFRECKCRVFINKDCKVYISGTDKNTLEEVFRLIWEVISLYEGYFYTIIECTLDDDPLSPGELYFLNYYVTGQRFYEAAFPLVSEGVVIDEKILQTYYLFRDDSIENYAMNRSLVNSYFYVRSDSYDRITVDHKLSIMINMCDGIMIGEHGDNGKIKDKLQKFFDENLIKEQFESDLELLGYRKTIYILF